MNKLLLVLAFLLTATAAQAQTSPPIRYHFGDDPDGKLGWANPNFDDSAWPVAPNGLVPSVAGRADSFIWVRMRVPLPANPMAPLALHLNGFGPRPMAWQAFFNGRLVGGQGSFPPRPNPVMPPVSPVMELPGFSSTGPTALVAVREWQALAFFETRAPSQPVAVIDQARVLSLAVRAAAAETLAQNAPEDALSVLLALVGVVLLLFWRNLSGREYLWAAIMLLVPLGSAILYTGPLASHLSFHAQTLAWVVVNVSGLIAEIELMWTLFRLRSRRLHILWHALWVAFIASQIGEAWFLTSPQIERLCNIIIVTLIPAFDLILFPVCIREMFRRKGNRAFAAAMCVMEVAIGLAALGYSVHVTLGPFELNLVQLTVMLVNVAIAGLLVRRAVQAWRARDELRVEFDAAREVQQQLVAPPGNIPRFHIGCVYQPARQVGGDFFRVMPNDDGSVLVVVGDVSGKGLRAAMTVSAIMGALRGYPTQQPAKLLGHLNHVLIGQLGGGFVTCCAVTISANGTAFFANAGHLQPYCNGKEVTLDCGLPLGILPDAQFTETRVRLAPTDRLTLITDGIVEARNTTSGELFGFERTQAISTQSAEAIAQAAQAFGQEDDITVLTLTLAPTEVAHA